jgi:tyrosyl-tRNA synthetase
MDDLLTRGVDEIISKEELGEALKGDRKLRIKFGVDVTSPDLHIGHAVVLRKLRQFQDLGHTVIFLIGDYTTKIGDPSGKKKTRPMLSDDEIKANVKTYLDQVGRVLDVTKAEIRYNSEWLGKLGFGDTLKLTSQFTVAQLVEREDFKNRLAEGAEVALHELLYPVMQAYDSVALEADVEFGGSDQRFNLLAGRQLQKKEGQRPQQVFMMKLMVGTDGENKMSKSLGNYIALTDEPVDMYGKAMSIPDPLIISWYELATEVPMGAIKELEKTLALGANPRDAKASLAREIVSLWHGDGVGLKAEEAWNQTYRDKSGPSEDQIEELNGSGKLVEVLVGAEAAASNSEVRRLVEQNGIRINGETVTDPEQPVKKGDLINIGKTRFYRVS